MKGIAKFWKNRPHTRQGWIDLYVSYLKRIPERHYFPIFVILSLYFVVPYSEFVVTALAPSQLNDWIKNVQAPKEQGYASYHIFTKPQTRRQANGNTKGIPRKT